MEPVTVAEFDSESKATLAKNLLERNGIKAYLGGSIPQVFDYKGLPVGCIVQVRQKDAERAAKLLRGARSATTQRTRHYIVTRANRELLLFLLVFLLVVFFTAFAIVLTHGM